MAHRVAPTNISGTVVVPGHGVPVEHKDSRLISRKFLEIETLTIQAWAADLPTSLASLPEDVQNRPAVVPEDALTTGADIKHEIQVPFNSVVVGGKAQVTLRRSSGKTETIEVNIPPGIESGKKIRLRGQGEEGLRGGKPGDILLTVHVGEHPYFQRQGSKNLLLRLPITLEEAVLGGKIDVPTPKGTVSLNIPKCTSGGQKLRVKGHGVQTKDGQPGDLLVETRIVLPKQIDESVATALKAAAEKSPTPNPRTEIRW